MSGRPAYFDDIRREAEQLWELLDQEGGLAGWRYLFKLVKKPQHVLSELLQNADDVGAITASVFIKDQVFMFKHNVDVFTQDHLRSLCRFGYSSKRTVHTTGFYGIGFKSTFSLGDQVDFFTPRHFIRFHSRRFTVPEWIEPLPEAGKGTCIRIKIRDQTTQQKIDKNLKEWSKNPVSLLFFHNIGCIEIDGRKVRWDAPQSGPIPEGKWRTLYGKKERVLLIQSNEEEFPKDALDEIKKERDLDTGEEMESLSCRVEIVLGKEGRLYTILPTDVETGLPFACNAPFIPNPDRQGIADPEVSLTNRWLLERAGRLAASTMLRWLGQKKIPMDERSHAYSLLPDTNGMQSQLGGICNRIVQDAFDEAIRGKDVVLIEDGQLVPKGQGIVVPPPALDVWGSDQAASLLDARGRLALCRSVEEGDRKKLLDRGVVDEISRKDLFDTLKQKPIPKPKTWNRLRTLWSYVASEILYYRDHEPERFKIVPVQGENKLYAPGEVFHSGKKWFLQSKDDWKFLTEYLHILDKDWLDFLESKNRSASEQVESTGGYWKMAVPARGETDLAYDVLKRIGLEKASDANAAINQVAKKFFQDVTADQLASCVQLAQIAAKLGASIGDEFRYVARDTSFKSSHNGIILFDRDGGLEHLLPDVRRESYLLHRNYTKDFKSCSREDWERWIDSGHAKIQTFIPLKSKDLDFSYLSEVEEEIGKRGFQEEVERRFKSKKFVLEDWDFDKACWKHWEKLAAHDEGLWVKIVKRILKQPKTYWDGAKSARLLHVAKNGNKKPMTNNPIPPSWVVRLRDLPCLPDRNNRPRKPVDLQWLTETALLTGQPVIHDELGNDVPARPLLDLLGVGSTPPGPDSLLVHLRSLASGEKPLVHEEVEELYRSLNRICTSSADDNRKISKACHSKKIILTQGDTWVTASEVFLYPDDEIMPDAPVIRSSVRDLSLWHKIDVSKRPTLDHAIEWLKDLPKTSLLPNDVLQVRKLLDMYPNLIWEKCERWLNLAGELAPVGKLHYALTSQSNIPWKHFYLQVKRETADLTCLSGKEVSKQQFSRLLRLAEHIKEEIEYKPDSANHPPREEWLLAFGDGLSRIKLGDEKDAKRIRDLAKRLAKSEWQKASELKTTPYIGSRRAGEPRSVDVVWQDNVICVMDQGRPKLARCVPEEIGRVFDRPDINAALHYSFGRPPKDVKEYLEANFEFDPAYEPEPDPIHREPTGSGRKPTDGGAGISNPDPTRGIIAKPIPSPNPPGRIDQAKREKVEKTAMDYVMKYEKKKGRIPKDVSNLKCGWDIESEDRTTDEKRHIEVKGHSGGYQNTHMTQNEWNMATKYGNKYYLYVVFHALDRPELHQKADPANKCHPTIQKSYEIKWEDVVPR